LWYALPAFGRAKMTENHFQISGQIEGEAEGGEWFCRSEYWQKMPSRRAVPNKKFRYREPLILCGRGINLRVDHATLLVRNGFTHYPQKAEEIRFFPGDPNLPDRIIISDGKGAVTLDALAWMADQRIEFVQLNFQGRTIILGGNSRYSAKPELVEAQRAAKAGNSKIEIARWLITSKIEETIATAKTIIPVSENREKALSRLEKCLSDIRDRNKLISMPKILGIEGLAAVTYFQLWHGLPLRWTGLSRKPVPADWSRIGPRLMTWRGKAKYQNARHPINAMLNYGYAILTAHLRTRISAVGLDPNIGMMHGNSENRMPLVYDLMEPLRPVVDRNILEFALGNTFSPGDFAINRAGGCRLNPQLAKAVIERCDFSTEAAQRTQTFVRLLQAVRPKSTN